MAAWSQQSGWRYAAIPGRVRPAGFLTQPGAGDSFTVTGIHGQETDEERHPIPSTHGCFVNLFDFSAPPDHGDEVTVDGALYTVFSSTERSRRAVAWLSISREGLMASVRVFYKSRCGSTRMNFRPAVDAQDRHCWRGRRQEPAWRPRRVRPTPPRSHSPSDMPIRKTQLGKGTVAT